MTAVPMYVWSWNVWKSVKMDVYSNCLLWKKVFFVFEEFDELCTGIEKEEMIVCCCCEDVQRCAKKITSIYANSNIDKYLKWKNVVNDVRCCEDVQRKLCDECE